MPYPLPKSHFRHRRSGKSASPFFLRARDLNGKSENVKEQQKHSHYRNGHPGDMSGSCGLVRLCHSAQSVAAGEERRRRGFRARLRAFSLSVSFSSIPRGLAAVAMQAYTE